MPHPGLSTLLATVLLLGAASCSPTPSVDSATEPTNNSSANAPATPERDPATLRLLYGRAAVTLNPHLATGYQDFEAARIVYEPLASFDAAGELVPFLAETIPSVEAGTVAEDGTSVVWELRQDVTWSDGEPFTAADVVFTFEFITNPAVAAATAQYYDAVETVEALDDYRVQVTFKTPTAAWAAPFSGQTGLILPRHLFAEANSAAARDAVANRQPVGTGPYQVVGFEPGTVLFEANPTYWDGAPRFQRVELVGGNAPYAAARAVLKTGEADFAQNLQVDAAALAELTQDGQGQVTTLVSSHVERIMLNFAHPFAATEDGERASRQVPHPYFSDRRVRQAVNLAIDRETIARQLYGDLGQPTGQLLVEPSQYLAPEADYEYDLEQAKVLLDEAGWVDTNGNGIRDRNGVEMEVLFQSAINPVRQDTQDIVSTSLEALGMDVEIARIRVDDFFSADPEQTNSLNHFFADLQIYSTGNESPDPATYMGWWTCDKIAAAANQWQEPNNARYCNLEYDRLWQAAQTELDPAKRVELFQQMNQLLVEDVAVIPVVHRAIANAINDSLTGVTLTPWDASTWGIKHWQRSSPDDQSS